MPVDSIATLNELRKQADKLAKEVYSKFSQKDIVTFINGEVCDYFGVLACELKNTSNKQPDVITARYCIFYLCNIYTCYSLRKIAYEYNTTLTSVRRGLEKLYSLNYRVKRDVVIHVAIENFKTSIESEIKANMGVDLDMYKNENQKQK